MVDTSDQWIMERTGIRERRIASPEMVTSDMAAEAARAALTMAGLKASDLDMIIVGTVTPDMPMPATAVFVQQKIGAGHRPAFDISAACAGFLFGLTLADGVIPHRGRQARPRHRRRAARAWSTGRTARRACSSVMPFAAVFGPSEGREVDSLGRPRGVLASSIHSDGELAASLWIPGGGSRTPASADMLATKAHKVHMRGQDIFKVAIKSLGSCK